MILRDIFGFAFVLLGLGVGIVILAMLSNQEIGESLIIYAGILSAISVFIEFFCHIKR